jgi:RNA polymerase sigma-70 factor (ECF subfamily)
VIDDRDLRDRFGALFRHFYPELCGFVVQYVRSRAIAEELVQDLFLRLWERRESWEQEMPSRSYLYRAARNRAFDHLKRQRVVEREAFKLNDDEENDPVVNVVLDAEDLRAALNRAIEELPPRTREVFVLSKRHGLTYPQIAKALTISVKTVETQMTRAFRILRERLSRYL